MPRGDANICGDVGSPKVVRFGEKGLMWIEVEATGSPAHGAHVHQRHQRHRPPARRARPAEGARDAARSRRRRSSRGDRQGQGRSPSRCRARASAETLQRVTVNIGTIEGGTSPNLVPTHAIARADIRLPVGITTDVLAAKLDEWLAPLEGVSWRAHPPLRAVLHRPRPRDRRAHRRGRRRGAGQRAGGEHARRRLRFALVPAGTACRRWCCGLTPFNMGGAGRVRAGRRAARRRQDPHAGGLRFPHSAALTMRPCTPTKSSSPRP